MKKTLSSYQSFELSTQDVLSIRGGANVPVQQALRVINRFLDVANRVEAKTLPSVLYKLVPKGYEIRCQGPGTVMDGQPYKCTWVIVPENSPLPL